MVSTRAKVKQETDDVVEEIDKACAAANSRNGDIRQYFRMESKTTSVTTPAGTDVTMQDQLTVISGNQISISSTLINLHHSTQTGTSIPVTSEDGVETNGTPVQDRAQKAAQAKPRAKSIVTKKATVKKGTTTATNAKAATKVVNQQNAISIEKAAVALRGSKRRSSSNEGKLLKALHPSRI